MRVVIRSPPNISYDYVRQTIRHHWRHEIQPSVRQKDTALASPGNRFKQSKTADYNRAIHENRARHMCGKKGQLKWDCLNKKSSKNGCNGESETRCSLHRSPMPSDEKCIFQLAKKRRQGAASSTVDGTGGSFDDSTDDRKTTFGGVGYVAGVVACGIDTTDANFGNRWCMVNCATGHFADPENLPSMYTHFVKYRIRHLERDGVRIRRGNSCEKQQAAES